MGGSNEFKIINYGEKSFKNIQWSPASGELDDDHYHWRHDITSLTEMCDEILIRVEFEDGEIQEKTVIITVEEDGTFYGQLA